MRGGMIDPPQLGDLGRRMARSWPAHTAREQQV